MGGAEVVYAPLYATLFTQNAHLYVSPFLQQQVRDVLVVVRRCSMQRDGPVPAGLCMNIKQSSTP